MCACVRAFCVCTGLRVCGLRRDWYKIKTQIERKHWNHHFLLSPAIWFLAPTVQQPLRGVGGNETESGEMYSRHDSEYLLSNTINTWRWV